MRCLMCFALLLFVAGTAAAQMGEVQESRIQLHVSYPQAGVNAPTPDPVGNDAEEDRPAPVAPPMITADVPAWLFLPSGQGRHPAVVFAHDGATGVTEGMKARCRDLARAGYVVLAPEYKGDGQGRAVKNKTAIQTFMKAREVLNNHPRVKQNFVGILGTSQGGYLALQTAIEEMGHWNCVVQASGAIHVPSTRTRVQSRVLLQHGDEDRVVLRKHANYLDATLRKTGTSCELKEYTLLDHNFWFWESKDYTVEEQAQADWAWEDVMAFLNDSLMGAGGSTNAR